MSDINKVFLNIDFERVKWLELVTAKVGCMDAARDIYQECNLKLLESFTNGRKDLSAVSNNDNINYYYYYKVLMTCAYDHLRLKKEEVINRFIDVETIELEDEGEAKANFGLDKVFSSGVVNLDLVIDNRVKSIPLKTMADQRGTNYMDMQRKVSNAMNELRSKLNG